MGVFRAQDFVLADIPRQPILLDGVPQTRRREASRASIRPIRLLWVPPLVKTPASPAENRPGAQPFDQLHLDNGCRRALIPGVHALVGGVNQHFARLANHQARAVQVRHALRDNRQGCLSGKYSIAPINRRLVTQTLFVKFKGDTLHAARQRFSPDTSQGLLQPLHNGLAGLLDNLLIGFNALPEPARIGFNVDMAVTYSLWIRFTPAASRACSNLSRNTSSPRR